MSRNKLFLFLGAASLVISACAFTPAHDYSLPPATAPTANMSPTSALLPPIAPNLVTPPDPLAARPSPTASPLPPVLPAAPPEIIAPPADPGPMPVF